MSRSGAISALVSYKISTRLVSVALAVALSSTVPDLKAQSDWDLQRLMNDLAQVKQAKANFVERKHIKILTAPLELSGTLIYSAPDRLEKHTLTPKAERIVVERDRLTIEAKRQRRTLALASYPVLWAFVESIRATLAGDLQALNRFYSVSLQGSAENWSLTLVPREQKMRSMVSSIRIAGMQIHVGSIEIQEADGDYSIMTVTEDAS